ncbi:MAG: DUF1326 domain-containing protein [Planctomycetales bacterium]|nr:DUF1326 domain-containing protein [Planctomycetales bacterium]
MMKRVMLSALCVAVCWATATTASAADISGYYMESRTCQVYTGPCFANAEIGLAGRDAIMAWNIQRGEQDGVNLAGLNVVVVVNASQTLAFKGMEDPAKVRSVVLVDEKATEAQRAALVSFVKTHGGRAGEDVQRVSTAPIDMTMDVAELSGSLTAGKEVTLKTRKVGRGDCICSNEAAYYPPLAKVEFYAPGVTIEGQFKGRSLGTRWSTPGDRSSYIATFSY